MRYIYLALVVFAGTAVQATTGLGFGMVAMALLPFVFPYIDTLVSMKMMQILFFIPVLLYQRKSIKWKILFVPVVASIIGTLIANRILFNISNIEYAKLVLGLIIVFAGCYGLMGKNPIRIKSGIAGGSAAGISVGFFSSFCGVAGPPLAVYLLGIEETSGDKDAYYATTITTFQLIGLYQIGLYAANGSVTLSVLEQALFSIVPAFAGVWAGQRLFRAMDTEKLKLIVYAVMIAMGLVVVVTSITALAKAV